MIPQFIIIHHSLTADGAIVNTKAIRNYHVDTLGWRDIGYHYLVEYIADKYSWSYEILVGRMENKSGAHCKQESMNYKSLGVCFIGDFDKIHPPEEQWRRGVRLVKSLIARYSIPVENVLGHKRLANYKSCPGKLFNMDKFREDLKREV